MSVTVYSLQVKDKRTGRWRKLRWQMTEEHAAEWAAMEGVPIEKIEGSEEVRTDVSGRGATFIPAQSTGAVEKYFNDLERALKAGQQSGPDGKWLHQRQSERRSKDGLIIRRVSGIRCNI